MFLDSMRIVALLLACPAFAQTAAPGRSDVDVTGSEVGQAVIAVARERASALESGDCQKWASYLDPSFLDIEGNDTTGVDKLVRDCERVKKLPQFRMQRILSNFHVRLIGQNVAVLDYHYEIRETFGSIVLLDPHRQIDTYEKRDGKWVGVLAVSALEVTDPRRRRSPALNSMPTLANIAGLGPRWLTRSPEKGTNSLSKPPATSSPPNWFRKAPTGSSSADSLCDSALSETRTDR